MSWDGTGRRPIRDKKGGEQLSSEVDGWVDETS